MTQAQILNAIQANFKNKNFIVYEARQLLNKKTCQAKKNNNKNKQTKFTITCIIFSHNKLDKRDNSEMRETTLDNDESGELKTEKYNNVS